MVKKLTQIQAETGIVRPQREKMLSSYNIDEAIRNISDIDFTLPENISEVAIYLDEIRRWRRYGKILEEATLTAMQYKPRT